MVEAVRLEQQRARPSGKAKAGEAKSGRGKVHRLPAETETEDPRFRPVDEDGDDDADDAGDEPLLLAASGRTVAVGRHRAEAAALLLDERVVDSRQLRGRLDAPRALEGVRVDDVVKRLITAAAAPRATNGSSMLR